MTRTGHGLEARATRWSMAPAKKAKYEQLHKILKFVRESNDAPGFYVVHPILVLAGCELETLRLYCLLRDEMLLYDQIPISCGISHPASHSRCYLACANAPAIPGAVPCRRAFEEKRLERFVSRARRTGFRRILNDPRACLSRLRGFARL